MDIKTVCNFALTAHGLVALGGAGIYRLWKATMGKSSSTHGGVRVSGDAVALGSPLLFK